MKVVTKGEFLGIMTFEDERRKLWIDPLFGLRLRYIPHPRIEFSAYGDFGGLLFGSDFSYQFIGLVNVICHKNFYVSGGYRLWSIEAERGEAILNGKIKGGVLKLGVQF
ncbi:MAG: hypothetical protein GY751_12360 [Bacteroidetes bacterium]|nr:hypothetical protein [Bacteroidota bacterium]